MHTWSPETSLMAESTFIRTSILERVLERGNAHKNADRHGSTMDGNGGLDVGARGSDVVHVMVRHPRVVVWTMDYLIGRDVPHPRLLSSSNPRERCQSSRCSARRTTRDCRVPWLKSRTLLPGSSPFSTIRPRRTTTSYRTSTRSASRSSCLSTSLVSIEFLMHPLTAVAGLSFPVLVALTNRIEAILSAHATSVAPGRAPERFRLVSRICRGGVALWVFAREKTTGGRLGKAVTSSVGLWRMCLSNKSAVGIRLPIRRGAKEGGWETLT